MNNGSPMLHVARTYDQLKLDIQHSEAMIKSQLSRYERSSAFAAWASLYRSIEELINLPLALPDAPALLRSFLHLDISPLDIEALRRLVPELEARFGMHQRDRFMMILMQCSAVAMHALPLLIGSDAVPRNMKQLIAFLQAHRRHFLAVGYIILRFCSGAAPVLRQDGLNVILSIVVGNGPQITGAHTGMLIKQACESLGIAHADQHELAMLDDLFLEPERLRITEVTTPEAGIRMLKTKEPLPKAVFSAEELRNQITETEAAYAEFDLVGTEFASVAMLARALSTHAVDGYNIAIAPADFDALVARCRLSRRLMDELSLGAQDYISALDCVSPFFFSEGMFRTTVTLVMRFCYRWRSISLDRGKRYQIRSGFIFERAVSDALASQGFNDMRVKRIQNQEFDVVMIRAGVLWNIQCKNNFTDLATVTSTPALFAAYNKRLVRQYERAISKELRREHLLKERFSTERVHHLIVARFPVISTERRIVPFSRIGTISWLADNIERS
ncbi:exodeoxyribonuclease V subunit gamma [Xanthomonas campestris pv. campestris]|uniref:exodeoxyribonuclease V subunit gamma n=1 Tax=Xanthomonas campestris TaxID=339 RepID=UPI001C863EB7|nr:exodeoxyribonuclease V subunit gamma [Xanthomonas campestris]MDM7693308.1 exodeoxyribonuclease V subunit gamma [Xanthomonas campestris pv. campestris]MDM7840530.1 exodeoxyribonuclease V subunit gamma [Xanthomonas campestris pv. campestris]MDM7876574.1 exodeoxyribonuclease V subunit gamma [Xanthomonas campestris pv. campestris]